MSEPDYSQAELTELHQKLSNYFDEEELRTLCFNLQVDYDALPAQGKGNKAREIVNYLARRGRIPELMGQLKVERPSIQWDNLKSDYIDPETTIEFSRLKFPAPPIAALIVKSGPIAGEWIFLTEKSRRILFGRWINADVSIRDNLFSRHHFTIIVTCETNPDDNQRHYQVEIMDLNSSLGTGVNGQRVQGSTLLQNGDLIQVGRTTFQYIWLYDATRNKEET